MDYQNSVLCLARNTSSLWRYLKDCNIFKLRREGRPIREADAALCLKLVRKTENEKRRVQHANKAKRYLTNNEELAIVQTCRILSMWTWCLGRQIAKHRETFVVKESKLLGPNFIIQQTYDNSSAEQRQRMLAKGKRKRQAEFRKKETSSRS
jgi:hypothetical protein